VLTPEADSKIQTTATDGLVRLVRTPGIGQFFSSKKKTDKPVSTCPLFVGKA
jgi:hypothetical protein